LMALKNKTYALKTINTAIEAGAEVIVLCDTNGGTMPDELIDIIEETKRDIKNNTLLGIHCHNDCDTAVASTCLAVKHGIVHVQGTINGYGERCGNANLCSVIPNLQLKYKFNCVDNEN